VAKVIVVTACDHRHFDLGGELIASLRAAKQRDFAIGFIRIGSRELPADISAAVDHTAAVANDREHTAAIDGFDVSYLGVKARLPELMPGFDTYVWMDGDTWLQNVDGIHQAVEAAQHATVAAACQADANYWACPTMTDHTKRAYMSIYGEEETRKWAVFPMVNAGVFAARASSPLWKQWLDELSSSRRNQNGRDNQYYSDQIPLHRLICLGRISFHPMRAVNNWLVCKSQPIVDVKTRKLRAPSAPWEELNIVHLADHAKETEYPMANGSSISFRYSKIAEFFGLS
jgi:hypothetical protein